MIHVLAHTKAWTFTGRNSFGVSSGKRSDRHFYETAGGKWRLAVPKRRAPA